MGIAAVNALVGLSVYHGTARTTSFLPTGVDVTNDRYHVTERRLADPLRVVVYYSAARGPPILQVRCDGALAAAPGAGAGAGAGLLSLSDCLASLLNAPARPYTLAMVAAPVGAARAPAGDGAPRFVADESAADDRSASLRRRHFAERQHQRSGGAEEQAVLAARDAGGAMVAGGGDEAAD